MFCFLGLVVGWRGFLDFGVMRGLEKVVSGVPTGLIWGDHWDRRQSGFGGELHFGKEDTDFLDGVSLALEFEGTNIGLGAAAELSQECGGGSWEIGSQEGGGKALAFAERPQDGLKALVIGGVLGEGKGLLFGDVEVHDLDGFENEVEGSPEIAKIHKKFVAGNLTGEGKFGGWKIGGGCGLEEGLAGLGHGTVGVGDLIGLGGRGSGLLVFFDHGDSSAQEVSEFVGEVAIVAADHSFEAVESVMGEIDFAQEEIADRVGIAVEEFEEIVGPDDIADGLGHFLEFALFVAAGGDESVAENPFGWGDAGGHTHGGPKQSVEFKNVFADNVEIHGPVLLELLVIAAVT